MRATPPSQQAELQNGSRRALVIGANGIVGRNMLNHLAERTRWQLLGLARSRPGRPSPATAVTVDLLDESASRTALQDLGPIDYVFFSALCVRPTPAEQVAPNLAMLRNALTPLLSPKTRLRHVCLVHGTKWYGSHLGPYRTPAKEHDARHAGPNFYYDQHDWLSAAQAGRPWHYATLRPHFINGLNVGNPNNMMAAIGVYAAIQRALGQPLHYPGTAAAYGALSMITNVGLLNEAMLWAATTPGCANQDFNLHNGDYFRWENLWPGIAEAFDMPVGDVRPIRLADYMQDKGPVWAQIAEHHNLQPHPLEQLVSWTWADFFFRSAWDNMSSTLKARRFGFEAHLDTEEDLMETLSRYRAERVLP